MGVRSTDMRAMKIAEECTANEVDGVIAELCLAETQASATPTILAAFEKGFNYTMIHRSAWCYWAKAM